MRDKSHHKYWGRRPMIRRIVCRLRVSRQQSASPSGHWIGGVVGVWGKEHNRNQARTLKLQSRSE